jgi:hypothetical protein
MRSGIDVLQHATAASRFECALNPLVTHAVGVLHDQPIDAAIAQILHQRLVGVEADDADLLLAAGCNDKPCRDFAGVEIGGEYPSEISVLVEQPLYDCFDAVIAAAPIDLVDNGEVRVLGKDLVLEAFRARIERACAF